MEVHLLAMMGSTAGTYAFKHQPSAKDKTPKRRAGASDKSFRDSDDAADTLVWAWSLAGRQQSSRTPKMARVSSVRGTAMLCGPAKSITGATTAGPRKALAKKESENIDMYQFSKCCGA